MIKKANLKKALDELNAFKKSKNKKFNYYSYDNAKKNYNFDIFFSLGTRTTGKSTATQRDIVLQDFNDKGTQFVKLCRYKDDLKALHQANWWTEFIVKTLHKYDIHIEYKGNIYYINEYDAYLDDERNFNRSDFIKSSQILGYVIPVMRQQNYK